MSDLVVDVWGTPASAGLCATSGSKSVGVFGRFWKGLLAVWIGGGIGQSMAFLLARYLISDLVSAMLRGKSRKWDMVSTFLCRHPADTAK